MAFDTYAAQDTAPDPIPLKLVDLRGKNGVPPIIHVVSAGEENAGWMADNYLDATGDIAEVGDAKYHELSQAVRDERNLRLRRRLARNVVKRLEHVVHDDGRNADGPEDILDFMTQIPLFVVRKILMFVIDPKNFQRAANIPAAAPDVIAGK